MSRTGNHAAFLFFRSGAKRLDLWEQFDFTTSMPAALDISAQLESQASHRRQRILASWISLVAGVVLLGIKFIAYDRTKSQAILSDALESIANVVAALIAVIVVRIADEPADRNHPYGHGKAEHFSAAFEGGLITTAAIVIILQVLQSVAHGSELRDLDFGLVLSFGAGIANLLLGIFLIRVGKRSSSPALSASGHHVISDFWTTFAICFGLVLVKWLGWNWADPVLAVLVALQLGRTGIRLMLKSADVLMDAEDQGVIAKLAELFVMHLKPGIIRIHHVRVIQSGRHYHVDAHVVVPEFWDVNTAHDETNRFAKAVFADQQENGDIAFHIDPCRKAYCRACDYPRCPVRRLPFEARIPITMEELVSPEEPSEFAEDPESQNSKR